MAYYGYGWAPYVPVAQRRRKARKKMGQLRKKGMDVQPIEIEGRQIATTFWGQAWCGHMESLGDFANRLPRGRTYVRNGSVCHLAIDRGCVTAIVSGSELYEIQVKIDELSKPKWKRVTRRCAGQIGSLLELLQGKLSANVMEVVTDAREGLFPLANEIRFDCDCPDWAVMCKHVAAVLYGVAARLDRQPELLFLLRGVKHQELVAAPADQALAQAMGGGRRRRRTLASAELAGVFGIELEPDAGAAEPAPTRRKTGRKKAARKKRTSKPAADKKRAAPAAGKKAGRKKAKAASAKKTTKASAGKTTKVAAKSARKKSVKKKPASKKPARAVTKKAPARKAAKKRAAKKRSSAAKKR